MKTSTYNYELAEGDYLLPPTTPPQTKRWCSAPKLPQ